MNSLQANQPETIESPQDARINRALQHRSDFRRLYGRYQHLSRCSSAADQRERSALQGPLLELYRALHPELICIHFDDDFDVVMRAERRA